MTSILMKAKVFLGILALVIVAAGCSGNHTVTDSQRKEADSIINDAYEARDYQRIATLVDSLKNKGLLSEGKANYWLGYSYDRQMQKRMAELYWKTGLVELENSTNEDDLHLYSNMASRLTGLKCIWGEYEAALKVAEPVVDRLQKLRCDTTSEYTNLLIYMGCCQSRFGITDSMTNSTLERSYQAHLNLIKKHPGANAYRDAMIGVINICFNYLEIGDYKPALKWVERYGELIEGYEKQPDARPDYIERQKARHAIFLATALEGVGQRQKALETYEAYKKSPLSQTAEGKIQGVDYLRVAGRWQEAADNYSSLSQMMHEFKSNYSLENIQKLLLKKYEANMRAGRIDSARAVSMDISLHLDSAITSTRIADAREQEEVHQKELEMVAEREKAQQQKQMNRLGMMASLIFALLVYIVVRHRAAKRLAEVKAAKERIESELRIARDIQMSMLPHTFPHREGLDMYASMTPAKEVGGDLYGYLLEGDSLYFAVGDVSGKGIPASLFMAQATRLFLTLAKQGMMPAEICTRMNDALSGEDNERNMFVTFFLGLINLKTGHMDFCNAGHNPPVIGGGENRGDFLEMKPNIPIGLFPGMKYEGEEIDCIKGRPLFIYTDGINEAENQQKEQFGDEHMMELLQNMHFDTAEQVIEAMRQEVEKHRNGTDPNDDLTMLALLWK